MSRPFSACRGGRQARKTYAQIATNSSTEPQNGPTDVTALVYSLQAVDERTGPLQARLDALQSQQATRITWGRDWLLSRPTGCAGGGGAALAGTLGFLLTLGAFLTICPFVLIHA